MSQPLGFEDKVAFVWKVADKLRGHLKPHEYGSVMLPLLVLRRLDAVLTDRKDAQVAKAFELFSSGLGNVDPILKRTAGQQFYNVSPLTFKTFLSDDKNVATSLRAAADACDQVATPGTAAHADTGSGQPDGVLERLQLRGSASIPDEEGSARVRGHVHVRDHSARRGLDEHVDAVAVRGSMIG